MKIFLWVWLTLVPITPAHDSAGNPDPPPVTCPQRCKKVQCDCVDICNKLGKQTGDPCFADCFDDLQTCNSRCEVM